MPQCEPLARRTRRSVAAERGRTAEEHHPRTSVRTLRAERAPSFAKTVYSQDTEILPAGRSAPPFRGTACCARRSGCFRYVSCCAGDFHSDSRKLRTSRLGISGTRKACAKLFSRSIALSFVKRAAAGEWSFGLCATRSREPRQARKGATVPGLPWAPQTTRSSSRRQPAILPRRCCRKFSWNTLFPSAIHNIVSPNSFPRFASNIFIS